MTLTMSQSNFYTETTSPFQIPLPPIPKGNMGYAQYAIPHTLAVEPTFVAFL